MLAAGCGGGVSEAEKADVVRRAKRAYAKAKASGVELQSGPCLGVIKPGWVADVAHDPRQAVDDEAANQCEAYREGDADHFVELDPDGNLIRVK